MANGLSLIGVNLGSHGIEVLQESYSATIELNHESKDKIIQSLEKSGFELINERDNIYTIKQSYEPK